MNTYLPGPSVCGLYGFFESDYGCPDTPAPYARVTPSKVASALLPFHCPKCKSTIDFSNPVRREHYHDTRVVDGKQNNNHWCPACGNRFVINNVGQPLSGRIGSDGTANSTVEEIVVGADGFVNVKRRKQSSSRLLDSLKDYVSGTDVLGSC
jgi:hypothetical protein